MDISEIRYYIGRGKENISMYRGNFNISDKILFRKEAGNDDISVAVSEDKGLTRISLSCRDKSINRIWIRIPAEPSVQLSSYSTSAEAHHLGKRDKNGAEEKAQLHIIHAFRACFR